MQEPRGAIRSYESVKIGVGANDGGAPVLSIAPPATPTLPTREEQGADKDECIETLPAEQVPTLATATAVVAGEEGRGVAAPLESSSRIAAATRDGARARAHIHPTRGEDTLRSLPVMLPGAANMIVPTAGSADIVARDLAHADLRVLRGTSDANVGVSARSLALAHSAEEGELPVVRAIVSGHVKRGRAPAEQAEYVISVAHVAIWSHPLHCAAMLADEPKKGESANCIFQVVDVVVDVEPLLFEARGNVRAAKLEALRRIGEVAAGQLTLAVACLIQVAPVGEDRRLTVSYGDKFARDYSAGTAPATPAFVAAAEVWDFLQDLGLERSLAVRALLRCGVAYDQETAELVHRERQRHRWPPVIRQGTSLEGPTTVPELEALPPHGVAETPAGSSIHMPIDLTSAVASLTVGSQGSRNAKVQEKQCKFVAVVVHDGEEALYLSTSRPVAMGWLTDSLSSLTGNVKQQAEGPVLWGVYAAQHVLRLKLGAMWEHDELDVSRHDVRLLGATTVTKKKSSTHTAWYELRMPRPLRELRGALQRCFEGRRPTPGDVELYPCFLIHCPGDLPLQAPRTTTDVVTIASIVQGDLSALTHVVPQRVEVVNTVGSEDMHRDDLAYRAGVETPYETCAFYDLQSTVATFYPAPPRLEHANSPATTKARRRRDPLDWDPPAQPRFDLEDDGEEAAEYGQGDDDEEEGGHDAYYIQPSFHPYTDDPAAFSRRLKPAGLPTDVVMVLRRAQATDPFCLRVRTQLQELRAYELELSATCELSVGSGGWVSLGVRVQGAVDTRTSQGRRYLARLERLRDDFHDGGNGVLYHIGEDRKGSLRVEYVVPDDGQLRNVLIEAAHDGMFHLGRERTLDSLRASGMWWSSMAADVKRYVRNCPTCARNKVGPHHGAMHIPPNGGKPWQVVAVDVVDMEEAASGMQKAVIFADRFGRGIRAFPCTANLDSKEFLNIVEFGLMTDVGTPLLMISDRGSNLTSQLCMEFYEHHGKIDPRLCDSHMHTGVALTERFNKTLREMARAAHHDQGVAWDLCLRHLVFFYNASVHEATGLSPFFVEHGREPRLPAAVGGGPLEDAGTLSDYVREHILALHLAWEVTCSKLEEGQLRRKEAHDGRYQTNVAFQPGDRVLVLQPGRLHKMDMPYIGPYRVLWGPDERDRYALRDVHGRRFNEFHVSKLKLWPLEDEFSDVEYYIVHDILDHRDGRLANGEREYLIHWQGYSKAKASWEPQSNLLSETALEMAQQYDASVGLATTAADSEPTGSDRADDANKEKGKKKKKKVTTPAPEDPVAGHDASAARALRMSRRAADREARSAEMELVD